MKAGKYNIEISNGSKILYPGDNITKQNVIDYYDRVSDRMLPLMKDRLLTMQRFPNGIGKQGFYQKDRSDYFPDWIKSKEIKKEGDMSTSSYATTKPHLSTSPTRDVSHFTYGSQK